VPTPAAKKNQSTRPASACGLHDDRQCHDRRWKRQGQGAELVDSSIEIKRLDKCVGRRDLTIDKL